MTHPMTADGDSPPFDFFGGDGTIFATGVFGGGTVKLQASIDGITPWFDCVDLSGNVGTLTVGGVMNFQIAACKLRAVLTGATAPNLTVKIAQR